MKKMDEMEMYHTLKSLRIVFLCSFIIEFMFWMKGCIVQGKVIGNEMSLLFTMQGMLLIFGQYYYKIKVGDPEGKKGILFASIIALLICAVGFCIAML